MIEHNKQVIFEFLDIVRESGGINMFEGARLLQDHYGLSRQDARDILLEWMQTFTQRHNVAK
jgi:hypothetical protein